MLQPQLHPLHPQLYSTSGATNSCSAAMSGPLAGQDLSHGAAAAAHAAHYHHSAAFALGQHQQGQMTMVVAAAAAEQAAAAMMAHNPAAAAQAAQAVAAQRLLQVGRGWVAGERAEDLWGPLLLRVCRKAFLLHAPRHVGVQCHAMRAHATPAARTCRPGGRRALTPYRP